MSRETAEQCIRALATDRYSDGRYHRRSTRNSIPISAGWLNRAAALGRHVIDRCNLTVCSSRRQADLAEFLAGHRVEIVASLPCYRAEQTDAQRGEGVFEKSIEALRRLEAARLRPSG